MPFKIWAPLLMVLATIGAWTIVTILERPARCPPGVVCIGAPLPEGTEGRGGEPWGPVCRPQDEACRPREIK